jgi:hypothetical protein
MDRTHLIRAAVLTDGASRLVDRFEQSDSVEILDHLSAEGPRRLLEMMRRTEGTDPNGERWRCGKVNDDATVAYCVP